MQGYAYQPGSGRRLKYSNFGGLATAERIKSGKTDAMTANILDASAFNRNDTMPRFFFVVLFIA